MSDSHRTVIELLKLFDSSNLSSLYVEADEIVLTASASGDLPRRKKGVGSGPVAVDRGIAAAHASDPTRILRAPALGTLRRSHSGDGLSTLVIGDRVEAGGTVCVLECSGELIPVRAEEAGEIADFFVGNGALVEYGQPILLLKVNGERGE